MKTPRMTLLRACNLVGLPELTIAGPDDIKEFHDKWKGLLVRARETNDDESAKALSQAWATVKRYQKRYCECGHWKDDNAAQCPECRTAKKRRHTLADPQDGPVEDGVPIVKWPKNGRIRRLLEELDAVGKSRVISAHRLSIYKAAKLIGLSVSIVAEKTLDGPNGRCRVWRTDGKTIEEVNAIIRERKPTL